MVFLKKFLSLADALMTLQFLERRLCLVGLLLRLGAGVGVRRDRVLIVRSHDSMARLRRLLLLGDGNGQRDFISVDAARGTIFS